MIKTHSSHDIFAKRFLTDLKVAADFLKAHLPEVIKSRCDFRSLKIEPTSYIEEDMRQHTTDILYSLKLDNKPGFIYCLIENQSKPEKLMALRFWRYQASILKHYAENNKGKSLPVIVPLLFYTGSQSPYPFSLDLADCFEDPMLAKEVLTGPIHLIDISVIPDDEIKTHGSAALLELVQKHIKARDILNLGYEIAALLRHFRISRDLAADMLKYVVLEGESQNIDAFLKIIQNETEYRNEAVTIAEQLIQ